VPAQIAEVADPLLALERLRDHLELLESGSVAKKVICAAAPRTWRAASRCSCVAAAGQVRRLNQQLTTFTSGASTASASICAGSIACSRSYTRCAKARRKTCLFSAALPIEEALDAIFKRYGGGGRSGGQRLLDYREYIELAVEVRRQASAAWEPANPTRLSTGEAIGVGAALMMVVLTQWEWDANLLRPRGALGSLRFFVSRRSQSFVARQSRRAVRPLPQPRAAIAGRSAGGCARRWQHHLSFGASHNRKRARGSYRQRASCHAGWARE